MKNTFLRIVIIKRFITTYPHNFRQMWNTFSPTKIFISTIQREMEIYSVYQNVYHTVSIYNVFLVCINSRIDLNMPYAMYAENIFPKNKSLDVTFGKTLEAFARSLFGTSSKFWIGLDMSIGPFVRLCEICRKHWPGCTNEAINFTLVFLPLPVILALKLTLKMDCIDLRIRLQYNATSAKKIYKWYNQKKFILLFHGLIHRTYLDSFGQNFCSTQKHISEILRSLYILEQCHILSAFV